MHELTGGVGALAPLRALLARAEADRPSVLARLEAVRRAVLAQSRERAVLSLAGDAATLSATADAAAAFAASLPLGAGDGRALERCDWSGAPRVGGARGEGFVLPGRARVNAVGKGGRLYAVGGRVRGSAQVVARARAATCGARARGGRRVRRDVPARARVGRPRARAATRTWARRCARTTRPRARSRPGRRRRARAVERAVVGAVGDLDRPLAPEQAGFVAMRRFLVGDCRVRGGSGGATRRSRRPPATLPSSAATARGDAGAAVVFGSREALDAANAEGADLEIAPAF